LPNLCVKHMAEADPLAQIRAVAASASPADRALAERIIAIAEGGKPEPKTFTLPPSVAALSFLHDRHGITGHRSPYPEPRQLE
jgi:hypothetical protein